MFFALEANRQVGVGCHGSWLRCDPDGMHGLVIDRRDGMFQVRRDERATVNASESVIDQGHLVKLRRGA